VLLLPLLPLPDKTKNQKSNLPQAVLSDSIEHSLILANRKRAPDLHRRLQRATLLDQLRQILPDMPALPKKHRHNGNHITADSNKLPHRGGQIRLHQLEKSQADKPVVAI
jgi:hypothetical protein